MARRAPKQWVYSPRKPTSPKIPAALKAQVSEKADELVDSYLKPTFIRPVPPDHQFNYMTDIYTKWWRSYFYFCSGYACPGPNALVPSFEARFARLAYTGNDRFTLSFMRYNDEWVEVYHEQTLDECLQAIKSDEWFHP